jgi:uncharacterized protein YukE
MSATGGDPTLEYNPAMIGEFVHHVVTCSSELEQIRSTCMQIVAGLPDGFKGKNADALNDVMAYINQGIDEGQQVIRLHGDAADTALGNFLGQDAAGAASMNSVL